MTLGNLGVLVWNRVMVGTKNISITVSLLFLYIAIYNKYMHVFIPFSTPRLAVTKRKAVSDTALAFHM